MNFSVPFCMQFSIQFSMPFSMQTITLNKTRLTIGIALATLALSACATSATPEVVRDFSRANTLTQEAQPTLTPTGPTITPSASPTPFVRRTDSPALDLNLPIVKIGDTTITLGEFRGRVRYERFRALNNARQAIERTGLARFNFANADGRDQLVTNVAAVFNTLANADGYGREIYDVVLREAVIRHEFQVRGLTLAPNIMDSWWKRELNLQNTPDADAQFPVIKDQYINVVIMYTGLTRTQIEQIAEANQIATDFRVEFAKTVKLPSPITYQLQRLQFNSSTDADAAYQALKGGMPFREVVCQYSSDPAQIGNGGTRTNVGRADLVSGLQGVDSLFAAEPGAIIGPLNSPLGWHIYKINAKATDSDGNTRVDLQSIQVATETLAQQIVAEVNRNGTNSPSGDFAKLACRYSLDSTNGNAGSYTGLHPEDLPLAVSRALNALPDKDAKGLLPVITVGDGTFEIVNLLERKVTVPKPQDVSDEVTRQFQAWQKAQAESTLVTTLTDAWKTAVPGDPLPRDVATFMTEENFGLPTPVPTGSPTPQAAPGPTP